MKDEKVSEASAVPPDNSSGKTVEAPTATSRPDHAVGYTEISTRALTNTARAVVSERLQVPIRRVSVIIFDDNGSLGLEINTPITWGLVANATQSPGSLLDRLDMSRPGIAQRMTQVSGRSVGKVNFEINGVTRAKQLLGKGRNLQ